MNPIASIILALLLLAPQMVCAEPIALNTPTGVLHGTLVLPKTRAPYPVALILAGSGPTNRDGDSLALGGENDSLHLLAEGLAEHGIASVRYDKRGIASSAKAAASEADLRFEHYIDDAVLWGRKLWSDRRFSSLTIIGHSEGSLIGMVAARRVGANAFVSIAGPGRAANVVLLEQLRAGLPPELFKPTEEIIGNLAAGKTTESIPQALNIYFRPSVQPYLVSWFRYDPAQEIAKLPIPVLITQGTADSQVSVQDARLLAQAKPSARLLIVDGMNHVLKTVAADNKELQQRTYTDPAFPVDSRLVDGISRFILGLRKQHDKHNLIK